ncbi:hypothetical protein GCM10028818_48030 [Spirosoma horti]
MIKFLLPIVMLSVPFAGYAQDQSVSAPSDSVQYPYNPIAKAQQLIKAGVGLPLFRQSSVSPPFKTVALDVTVEHKIKNGLSLIGGLETHYCFSQYAQLYTIELPLGLRYYFSLGKRMRNRPDPHSFFSYYIALQTHNALFSSLFYDTPNPGAQRYYRGRSLSYDTNVGKYDEAFNMMQHAYIQVGSQFRLPKSTYLDVNVVVPVAQLVYTKYELTLATPAYINIKYGVAWQK